MNKIKCLITGLTIALSSVINSSLADGNSINILGEVADETCQVRVNDATPVVSLPTAFQEDLAMREDTTGKTPFVISLYDCPVALPCSATPSLPPVLEPEQPSEIVTPGDAPSLDPLLLETDDEFDITLGQCDVKESSVPISVVFKGNNVTSSGNLGNISGTANNVEIQILDTDENIVNLSAPFKQKVGEAGSGSSFDSQWYAQYYASGPSTAGTVRASLQYNISYQ